MRKRNRICLPLFCLLLGVVVLFCSSCNGNEETPTTAVTTDGTAVNWQGYLPTVEEIAFAAALTDTEGLSREVNLALRILWSKASKSDKICDYDVVCLASKGDLYAVYLSGIGAGDAITTENFGGYSFVYPDTNTIRIYSDGRLIPMKQAYEEGKIDMAFVAAIHSSPANHFQ